MSDERRKGEVEVRVKQSAKDYGEDAVRAAFQLGDVPKTLPAYGNLRVDESGRVWVWRYPVLDSTRTSYDVFDSTGAYLGPVTASLAVFRWGRQAWTRDGFVTVGEDEEGRPTVVRMRLEVINR